jgi:hypothetical protein
MSAFKKEYVIQVPIQYTNNPMLRTTRKNNNNLSNLNLSNIEEQILHNTNLPLRNRRRLIRNRRKELNTKKNRKRTRSLMTYRTPNLLESRI